MFGITKKRKKTLWYRGMFALITPQMKSLEEGYKYLGSESTFVVLRVFQQQLHRNQEYIKIKGPQLTGSALLKG